MAPKFNLKRFDLDEDLDLDLTFQDIEQTVDFGPDVDPKVAERIEKTVSRPLSKENQSKLNSELKIPRNCKFLNVPKMNREIWERMRTQSRMQDLNLQQIHQIMAQGLTTLTLIANEVSNSRSNIEPKVGKKILKLCMNGSNLMGEGFQKLITKRRAQVKPLMNSDFSGICSSSVPASGGLLFGENLAETLKSSRNTAQVFKKGFQRFNSERRFKPYEKPGPSRYFNQNQPLNQFRPFHQQHRKRGGSFNNQTRLPGPPPLWKAPQRQ